MADNKFCKFCGAHIPTESQFCLKCGATLTSTTATKDKLADFPHSRQNEPSTREPYSPPSYSQKQASPSGLGPSFWLGLVGGVVGILGGVLALAIGSFSYSYSTGDSQLYWLGAGAILFSVMGIVGGVFDKKPKVGATLMIVAAIGILISISLFGMLSCILFFVGGVLIIARKRTF